MRIGTLVLLVVLILSIPFLYSAGFEGQIKDCIENIDLGAYWRV